MKIVFLGAGAWGTALAVAAARAVRPQDARAHLALRPATQALQAPPDRQQPQQQEQPAHRVTLWARDPAQVKAMQIQRQDARETGRENARYLPGISCRHR